MVRKENAKGNLPQEIHIVKKITQNNSEQTISVKIKYSSNSIGELIKSMTMSNESSIESNRKTPGVL